MKPLNSSISPGKVTFTIPDGYCSTEISFTSYSYPVGVTPEPSGKPYEKAAVYSNVTASYGPGTHTVQTDLPCGYWSLELYKGSVTAQLNTENGHAADQQIARLVNSVVNSCSSSSDSSDSSSDSGSSGSGSSSGGSGAGTIADPVVIESFDFLDAKALCTEKDGVYRFQLTNRNSSDLTISYSLAGQKVWTETVLPAGGTKTIEIVSDQAAPLQLTVNGTTKTVARAAADKCSSSGGSTGGGTGTGTGTGTNGTGGTPNGSGGTPNGLENLGNSPVPTGPAQSPAPSASGNGQGTAGTDSGNGAQDNGPIPLGYSSLPQTGESFPWGYYADRSANGVRRSVLRPEAAAQRVKQKRGVRPLFFPILFDKKV
ncbi:hypothetical protein LJK87_48205 [Paenibacillus sp. P25]|nr:hypothetical protein LJK87_48205 [Paenibacillus sp. P25]